MNRCIVVPLVFMVASAAWAQQSASYRLEEQVFNTAGHPTAGVSPASPSYVMARGSVGEALLSGVLASGSFQMSGGFLAAYPPPGEVLSLQLPVAATLTWQQEGSAGTYNLYRAAVSTLPSLSYGACQQQGLTSTSAASGTNPPPGTGYFYLVTVENLLGEEGTKGFRSGGTERAGSACP